MSHTFASAKNTKDYHSSHNGSPRNDMAVLILSCTLILFPTKIKAYTNPLIINEIGAYEKSGIDASEWIELYNRSGESVDISGWKFVDSVSTRQETHLITIPTGVSPIIAPHTFAILAQNPQKFKTNYPTVSVSVFGSNWTTLNEGGELIALQNAQGIIQEQFIYSAAASFSLERKNPLLDDYSSANWQMHLSGNSVGFTNSNTVSTSLLIENPLPQETTSTPIIIEELPIINVTSTLPVANDVPITETTSTPPLVLDDPLTTNIPPIGSITPPSTDWGDVRINEIMSDPVGSGHEWVELINMSNREIDLSNWTLADGSEKKMFLKGTIAAHGYILLNELSIKLNNDGDVLSLANEKNIGIDMVMYGIWGGENSNHAPVAKSGATSARKNNGISTGNEREDFAITFLPTPGFANTIFVPPKIIPPIATQNSIEENNMLNKLSDKIILPSISFSEVFPNPVGADTKNEFIELYNMENSDIDLAGWYIRNESGTKYRISEKNIIPSQSYLALLRTETHLVLPNTHDEHLFLYDPHSTLVDEISYDGPTNENISYASSTNGWKWTVTPTPGAHNIITKPNFPPHISYSASKEGRVNESIIFDASDTLNSEYEKLFYLWNFGDGVTTTTPELTTHTFNKAGNFTIELSIGNGSATSTERHRIHILKEDSGIVETTQEKNVPITKKISTLKKIVSKEKKNTMTAIISLDEFASQKENTRVSTTGTIIAPPGIIGKQSVMFGNPGIQIYLHSATFPTLVLGDTIQLKGLVTTHGGMRTIKLENKNEISVIGRESVPMPSSFAIADLDEPQKASLIKINGEVMSVQKTSFVVDDTSGSITVVARPTAKIAVFPKVGDTVEITGILTALTPNPRIILRVPSDIIIVSPQNNVGSTEITTTSNARDYLPAALGGLASTLITVGWKKRNALAGSIAVNGLLQKLKIKKTI